MDAARCPRRASRATLACRCLAQVLQDNLVVLTHALQHRQVAARLVEVSEGKWNSREKPCHGCL